MPASLALALVIIALIGSLVWLIVALKLDKKWQKFAALICLTLAFVGIFFPAGLLADSDDPADYRKIGVKEYPVQWRQVNNDRFQILVTAHGEVDIEATFRQQFPADTVIAETALVRKSGKFLRAPQKVKYVYAVKRWNGITK